LPAARRGSGLAAYFVFAHEKRVALASEVSLPMDFATEK